jgi:YVTN family beta-propeller protein
MFIQKCGLFIWIALLVLSNTALFGNPVVTSLSPHFGSSIGGTLVTIRGSGFTEAEAVYFGEIPASFSIESDGVIIASSPEHSPEVISVSVKVDHHTSSPTHASYFVYQGDWKAYITHFGSNNVLVVRTSDDQVIATPNVGKGPVSVGITPDGAKAYITNFNSNNVSIIQTSDETVIATLDVGYHPISVNMTPDGSKAYILSDQNIAVINTSDDTVMTTSCLGSGPASLAMTPNGKKAYVTHFNSHNLAVIKTADESVITTLDIDTCPDGIVTTSDGEKAYVTHLDTNQISVIHTGNQQLASKIINVGSGPAGIAMTPDGTKAYVANFNSNNISVIQTSDDTLLATSDVGSGPAGVVITPDGTKAYVPNFKSNNVSVIQTSDHQVIAKPNVGFGPTAIAITPDGKKAYVTNISNSTLSVIKTSDDTVDATLMTGNFPVTVAITPDQAPLAKFSVKKGAIGYPSIFDASDSLSPVGNIVNYAWDFGDGETLQTSTPIISHVYVKTGVYSITLRVTNSAGTSTQQISRPASSALGFFHFGSTPFTSSLYASHQVTYNGGDTAVSTQNLTILLPEPCIKDLQPNIGPIAGMTPITLTGVHFTGATAVMFGSVPAAQFTVKSDTCIEAIIPPGIIGTVDVRVTAIGGESLIAPEDRYTYIALPNIKDLYPNMGPLRGDLAVTITGEYFTGATAVLFGSQPALRFNVESDTSIEAVAPPGVLGPVYIQVIKPGGEPIKTSASQYTYLAVPKISSVSPNGGPTAGGVPVKITGTHFIGTTSVLFGGRLALKFIVESDTSILALSPPGGAGPVDMRVITYGGESVLIPMGRYNYLPNPAVLSINPNAGPLNGGTLVTLTGINFKECTEVLFGSTPALSFIIDSDKSIRAVAPPGAANSVNIQVIAPGGSSLMTPADYYHYVAPPVIKEMSSHSGSIEGGTTLTIIGENLKITTGVLFGIVSAPNFTVQSNSSIEVVVPPGAVGAVDVRVQTPGGLTEVTSVNQYTYIPPPIITNVKPNGGPLQGGTTVTIIGDHFNGVKEILFGSTPALSFTIQSNTTIQAIAPPGVAGSVSIRIITPVGPSSSISVDQYTYLIESLILLPPRELKGRQVRNQLPKQIDIVNTLHWKGPSSGAPPVAYHIYRDQKLTKLLAVISADEKLSYSEHHCQEGRTYHYYVVSVSKEGNLSESAEAVIKGRK